MAGSFGLSSIISQRLGPRSAVEVITTVLTLDFSEHLLIEMVNTSGKKPIYVVNLKSCSLASESAARTVQGKLGPN